ncbi:unnamed protein product [Pleuronectes platessa]|uniref:TIR domain-containing protein n=1 Tax=Pleuronectes platessa TaxID=8262 RepID=A0A9N7VT31_PLEPL|nr:unnamed protein product [Pleuronectes platessa]
MLSHLMCLALPALWCCLCASTATVSYPKTLPCDVSEASNGSTVTVDCTERGLTDIPLGIPRETTNLTLTINHIPELNSSSFHGLVNLTEIDMRCNCVPIKIGPKDRVCTKSVTIKENTFTSIKSLRALYLDGNQLFSIPKGLPPNLILLSLEVNHIYYISKANFSDLGNIQMLYLGQNCYYRNPCNVSYDIENGCCWIRWRRALALVPDVSAVSQTTVTIPRLATDVTCAAPEAQTGHPVISVDLLACQHNKLSIILYTLMTSLILSFLTLSIASHLFLWDIWYVYHFCRAKIKGYGRLYSQSSVYDAFVMYDKEDPAVSEWVMREMCVHLEDSGDHHFSLCLEERDWLPGCPLIDNLSQSINRSKRTVFILTDKYIKSGNFKTAFYMANQRLMDEKDDVIVLIFLQKVPCNSKYLRLRKRLYKGSVLEWPTNAQAQPYFWFSLRSVLATESHKQYSNLFKETL